MIELLYQSRSSDCVRVWVKVVNYNQKGSFVFQIRPLGVTKQFGVGVELVCRGKQRFLALLFQNGTQG